MGLQDDRMSGNIQDIARLITRLLLQGDMPQYTLPAAEADYTEADQLFSKIMDWQTREISTGQRTSFL